MQYCVVRLCVKNLQSTHPDHYVWLGCLRSLHDGSSSFFTFRSGGLGVLSEEATRCAGQVAMAVTSCIRAFVCSHVLHGERCRGLASPSKTRYRTGPQPTKQQQQQQQQQQQHTRRPCSNSIAKLRRSLPTFRHKARLFDRYVLNTHVQPNTAQYSAPVLAIRSCKHPMNNRTTTTTAQARPAAALQECVNIRAHPSGSPLQGINFRFDTSSAHTCIQPRSQPSTARYSIAVLAFRPCRNTQPAHSTTVTLAYVCVYVCMYARVLSVE